MSAHDPYVKRRRLTLVTNFRSRVFGRERNVRTRILADDSSEPSPRTCRFLYFRAATRTWLTYENATGGSPCAEADDQSRVIGFDFSTRMLVLYSFNIFIIIIIIRMKRFLAIADESILRRI